MQLFVENHKIELNRSIFWCILQVKAGEKEQKVEKNGYLDCQRRFCQ